MASINTDILDGFTFYYEGSGHYRVFYSSAYDDEKCRMWEAVITDMELIDCTLNAEKVKRKDVERLKRCVKSVGELHYYRA